MPHSLTRQDHPSLSKEEKNIDLEKIYAFQRAHETFFNAVSAHPEAISTTTEHLRQSVLVRLDMLGLDLEGRVLCEFSTSANAYKALYYKDTHEDFHSFQKDQETSLTAEFVDTQNSYTTAILRSFEIYMKETFNTVLSTK